jgi:hypothetical protein
MLLLTNCVIIAPISTFSAHQADAIISQRVLIFPIPFAIETNFGLKKM